MYKFLREGLKSENGKCKWKTGQWKKHKGNLKMCESGFHCSKEKYQAFTYVQGEILAEVEVRGKSIIQEDKECWSEMIILKAWKWQKKDSVALAIYSAELVLGNFEKVYPDDKRPRQAIEAAKKWLDNPTKENMDAADAADAAAYAAANDAAHAANAAYAAANDAANDAAYAAANDAAYAAAYAAANAANAAYAAHAAANDAAYAAAYAAADAAYAAHAAYDAAYDAANAANDAAYAAMPPMPPPMTPPMPPPMPPMTP